MIWSVPEEGRARVWPEVKWWARWWVRYFPELAYKRLRYCLRGHRGPMHDCTVCLTCAAPWFGASE